jgi:HEAT repeat protein
MTRKTLALLLFLVVLLVAMSSTAGCAPNIERLEQKQDIEGLIKALDHPDNKVRRGATEALDRMGEPAVEPLIAALKDGDRSRRLAVAKVLGQSSDPRALEPLIAALKDEDWLVRSATARALGRIGDTRVVEPLIAALKDTDYHVRDSAVGALGEIGDPSAVEPLIAALKDKNGKVRWSVIYALDNLGWFPDNQEDSASYWAVNGEAEYPLDLDSMSVTQLITALYHPEAQVRQAAAQKLGQAGDPRAVEPLIDALKDVNREMRKSAAEALGTIGDPRAVELLIAALKDVNANREMRQSAAEALGKISDPRAVEPLIASLKDRNFPYSYAVDALGQIGEPAVEPLIAAFEDEDFPSAYAAEALGKIGDPCAVEPLIAALKDKDKVKRKAVAEALGQIGDPRAIEPLIAVLGDEDGAVKASADSALVQIGLDDPFILVPFLRYASTVEVYRALIRIGDPATVSALVTAIEVHGSQFMAEYYLDSGNDILSAAADQWGSDRGLFWIGKRHSYYWGTK